MKSHFFSSVSIYSICKKLDFFEFDVTAYKIKVSSKKSKEKLYYFKIHEDILNEILQHNEEFILTKEAGLLVQCQTNKIFMNESNFDYIDSNITINGMLIGVKYDGFFQIERYIPNFDSSKVEFQLPHDYPISFIWNELKTIYERDMKIKYYASHGIPVNVINKFSMDYLDSLYMEISKSIEDELSNKDNNFNNESEPL